MAGGKYSMTPVDVPAVDTPYRKIQTPLPVPESLPIFEDLMRYEPVSMQGQPPVVWDRASDFQVHDAWGNTWLDWSSGVLITNSGHGHPEMIEAIRRIIDKPLLATYCFPHADRARLVKMLAEHAPAGLDKAFLLSTGSEATENCIKLAKTWGREQAGPQKNVFVTFVNTFHGRTMGAQTAGGMAGGKAWIGNLDPTFVQVPFPDGFKNENTDFSLFESTLADAGVAAAEVAGVMSETYQGVGPDFMPDEYAQQLRKWCDDCGALLIFDEVQAGFGRTGTYWGFEQYGITPDLIACGKGISGALPLSAVIGRGDVMDLYGPGSMTSTHSASPVAVASAIANLEIIDRQNLVQNAADLGPVLAAGLDEIQQTCPPRLGCVRARGMVGGIQVVKPGTRTPDPDTAFLINESCFHKGLLMFAPVGIGGECIKISPPLTTPKPALDEGLEVLAEVCAEVLD
ncbi:MAG: aspartate aminotransferase family protein [Lentisphaeria bacterium]|jgi:4-aminobutyrate aminotransferase-like enzyme|nr:aspartate aminotransferase family protein [Lentisphaeria bacterium]